MQRMIIDVREPHEYAKGHVTGAVNIPGSELARGSKQLEDLPKDTELILYCRSGGRSGAALNALRNQGYTNLINGVNQTNVEAKYL